tara:strand:+ start:8525 stop:9385 length:861 start_codon:yes stop_codon:yes gene_type:complete
VSVELLAKPVVDAAITKLKNEVSAWIKRGVMPSIKVLLVGNHPPSLIYTRNKKRFIESLGAKCEIIHLDQAVSEQEFLQHANTISTDPLVHGCFVQLPLPKQLAHIDVATLFPAKKDVDGFHPDNLRAMVTGNEKQGLMPCTPKGIMSLLRHYKFDPKGKVAVVIGRSMIVGKPMAMMLTNANATVSLCHSKTQDLSRFTQNADLIIVAVGSKDFLKTQHLGNNKPWVIDVGQNVVDNNLYGDVAYETFTKCGAITPVPGGVGPMTICSLGENLLQAVALCQEKSS